MPMGPGKYDELCKTALDAAKAEGAILMIVNGEHGNGFSVIATAEELFRLPAMLRGMADDIEESFRYGRVS
jgi:hypothetical protein